MAKAKRSRLERERDLAEVARRHVQGEREWQIAEALGVSQQQVSYDLRTLQGRWREAAGADIAAHKAQELARIDHLEEVYWQRWAESLKQRQVTSTSRRVRGAGPGQAAPVEEAASVRTEQRDGNPAFLAGVQWCIDRRCKLLGLDEPLKVDLGAKAREIAREYGLDEVEAVLEAERIVRQLAGG